VFLAPVIERELRRASHRKHAARSRFRVALAGAAVVILFLFIFTISGSGWCGQKLHQMFFWAGLYLAIVPALRISAGLFSEERRNQTLELLFLTGMGSSELFVGKLLGGILVASSDLLALAPLLAMPLLMGGISLNLYLTTLMCLPALLLFILAVGVLASVIFKDEGVAFILTVLIAGGISLAIPIPYYLGRTLIGSAPIASKWLCLSPAYAPYLISINFVGAQTGEFWMAMLALLAWSGLCLALACFVLSRNWRAEVQGAQRTGSLSQLDGLLRGWRSQRTSSRHKLLQTNPFEWLTERDRRPILLGYGVIGCICLLWVVGWRTWPRAWPSNANFFLTSMLLIAIFNWLRLFTAARRFGTDRREGIFELLLTTPLSAQEMVDGTIAAVTNEFKPLQCIVASLVMLMMVAGFMIRSWNVRAAITYALVWCVLCGWCLVNPRGQILRVMWAALNTGRPVYSVCRWRGSKWTWVWMLFNARNLIRSGFVPGAAAFPTGSVWEFTFVCIAVSLVCVFYSVGRTVQQELERDLKRRLIMEMRLIATEPLPDPHDADFEKWESIQRVHYRAASIPSRSAWPPFMDSTKSTPASDDGRQATLGKISPSNVAILQNALHLFELLEEREIGFLAVGGLAMQAYLADRTTRDADLLLSSEALKSIPELEVEERVGSFCHARFRGIRVILYLTENPFFHALRQQCTTRVHLDGREFPAATVEGLIALNLYALYCLSRQGDYYRTERYELNIIALLARYPVSGDAALTLVGPHIPPQNTDELGDTLKSCGKYAARLRRRVRETSPPRLSCLPAR